MNPFTHNSQLFSQFSFEECPLESSDVSKGNFPFNHHQPKTEIFPSKSPLFIDKLATEEDLIPILEWQKIRHN